MYFVLQEERRGGGAVRRGEWEGGAVRRGGREGGAVRRGGWEGGVVRRERQKMQRRGLNNQRNKII